jgi:hypothetical protein
VAGFNEVGALGVVIQRRPQPLHGIVQSLFKVNKRVGRPKVLLQFFPGDSLARTLQQHDQDVDRLPLQPDLHPLFAEFPGFRIELEHAKAEGRRNGTGSLHDHYPSLIPSGLIVALLLGPIDRSPCS